MTSPRRCTSPAGHAGKPRTLGGAIAVAVVVGALAGCSIPLDDAPRDVPEDQRRALDINEQQAGSARGATRIFLVAPAESGDGQVLRPVLRDSPNDAASTLRALLRGPNDQEVADDLSTALPAGLELQSATRLGDTVTVDVSSELLNVSGEGSVLSVAQIVATATELEGVTGVWLRVDGELQTWAGADGELLTGPLTIYDYPRLVETSQPAYPGIPSRR